MKRYLKFGNSAIISQKIFCFSLEMFETQTERCRKSAKHKKPDLYFTGGWAGAADKMNTGSDQYGSNTNIYLFPLSMGLALVMRSSELHEIPHFKMLEPQQS